MAKELHFVERFVEDTKCDKAVIPSHRLIHNVNERLSGDGGVEKGYRRSGLLAFKAGLTATNLLIQPSFTGIQKMKQQRQSPTLRLELDELPERVEAM
ncbi:MAG: hypothetical protein AAB401_15415 [Acidobacteriota bacterium]